MTQSVEKQLFIKEQKDSKSLRPVLQYLKSKTPGKKFSFSYVEDSDGLLPHLNLLENIQVITSHNTWKEILDSLPTELKALGNLISHHEKLPNESTAWDHLIIGLIKAHFQDSHYIIVDLCEDNHNHFNLIQLKRYLSKVQKNIVVASHNMSLWLDMTDTLIERNTIEFKSTKLLKTA